MKFCIFYGEVHAVADLGGRPGARPPRPKIFLISCSFSENLTKLYVGAPLEGQRPLLQEILDPHLTCNYKINERTRDQCDVTI